MSCSIQSITQVITEGYSALYEEKNTLRAFYCRQKQPLQFFINNNYYGALCFCLTGYNSSRCVLICLFPNVAVCQLRCIKRGIDFAIIGNQSEIDFFLVLAMRTTTLVFSAVFLFLRISRFFAIAPLSSLLIFSAIDFPFFYFFSGRPELKRALVPRVRSSPEYLFSNYAVATKRRTL